MQSTEVRIAKLKDIKENEEPCAKKDIHYMNNRETMNVYNIPLEYLIFNQYNGRIATFVKTYERQHGPIDATTEDGESTIAQFLWDSKKARNKITQDDLREKGQLEYGIVTSDGVVIDGNRRFMLLKKNKEKYENATEYFKAIILKDTLESNPKEIMALETTYQMGVDDKVDYNPIQKYLKCRDLGEQGFTEGEIAKMMSEKPAKIKEYLSILELMDHYLISNGYEGMYRVLEDEKLEGHFVDLNNYLSRYKGESGRIQKMNWTPRPEDIAELQKIYFDYMRSGSGVHDIRVIANPAKGAGIFTKKDIWQEFSQKHFDTLDQAGEEPALQEMREENPTLDVVEVISSRDDKFGKKVDNQLKGNLGRNKRELEDQNAEDEPLVLLDRAHRTLIKINTDVESFGSQEVHDLAKNIEKLAYELKKTAADKMK